MTGRASILKLLVLVLPALTLAWTFPARGVQIADKDTVVLVAKPQFQDPVYGGTILIARALGDGRHVGFILNKPTKLTLAESFPGHEASKVVRDPIYMGGPAEINAVFALVASHDSPGRGSMQLDEDLYLVIAQDTVNHVLETDAERARFFAGAVVWRPGELDEEVRRGAWYVLDPDPALVLSSKTEGLWQTLVHRADLRENGI